MARQSTNNNNKTITEENRDFLGVWFPCELWLDTNLPIMERCFLVEITSLNKKKAGCFASNRHFSRMFGLSIVRVSQIISALKKKELIAVKIDKQGGNKRRIWPNFKPDLLNKSVIPIKENFNTPIKEKFSSSYEKVYDIESTIESKSKTKNTNGDNKKDFSLEDDLGLELQKLKRKAAMASLKLNEILPCRTNSDRTNHRKIMQFCIDQIHEGELSEDTLEKLKDWAVEAVNSGRKPKALFMAMIKERIGYKPNTGWLLTGSKKISEKIKALKKGVAQL